MNKLNQHIEASLFTTCIIDNFYPEIGESTAKVLDYFGVKLNLPENQSCCGQPAFNSGYWKESKKLAKKFITDFENSNYIIVPSGSCASMIKVFYKELLHDEKDYSDKITVISNKIFEFSEFIVDILDINDLSTYTKNSANNEENLITYHESCHLRRELNVKNAPRQLLSTISNTKLVEMDQSEVCCGFGGTFSIKYPEISFEMLKDKICNIKLSKANCVTSCDASCLMQISGGLNKQNENIKSKHISQIINENLKR